MESCGIPASDFEITTFKKNDRVDVRSPINIICADFDANVDGDELVYNWPKPRTFMRDETKKMEVWVDMRDSVVPMLHTIQPTLEVPVAVLLKDTLTPERLAALVQDWKKTGTTFTIGSSRGESITVYPDERPGNSERELTLDELVVLAYGVLTLGGDVVRVRRKGGNA